MVGRLIKTKDADGARIRSVNSRGNGQLWEAEAVAEAVAEGYGNLKPC